RSIVGTTTGGRVIRELARQSSQAAEPLVQPSAQPSLDQSRVRHLMRQNASDLRLRQPREQIIADAEHGAAAALSVSFQPHPRVGVHLEPNLARHADAELLRQVVEEGEERGRVSLVQRDVVRWRGSEPEASREDPKQLGVLREWPPNESR